MSPVSAFASSEDDLTYVPVNEVLSCTGSATIQCTGSIALTQGPKSPFPTGSMMERTYYSVMKKVMIVLLGCFHRSYWIPAILHDIPRQYNGYIEVGCSIVQKFSSSVAYIYFRHPICLCCSSLSRFSLYFPFLPYQSWVQCSSKTHLMTNYIFISLPFCSSRNGPELPGFHMEPLQSHVSQHGKCFCRCEETWHHFHAREFQVPWCSKITHFLR